MKAVWRSRERYWPVGPRNAGQRTTSFVIVLGRMSRVHKLSAKSCLPWLTEQTHLKLRSIDHKCPDAETSLLILLYIQEGRLVFGAVESCTQLIANSHHLQLYSSDVTHIFQQLKQRLNLYFPSYYPLATERIPLRASLLLPRRTLTLCPTPTRTHARTLVCTRDVIRSYTFLALG